MKFWDRLKLKIIASSWEEYGDLKYTRLARDKRGLYKPADYSGLIADGRSSINFKHSGNSGDIIYALPTVKVLSENKKAKLFLQLDRKASYASSFEHPLGNVMLNRKMAEMLIPLLEVQEYVDSCTIFDTQSIDVDLDEVRRAPLAFTRLCLTRWYSMAYGINYDLSIPWLKVKPSAYTENSIIVARSNRYHGAGIDYGFLKSYPDVCFIGVEAEYNDMKMVVPNIRYAPVRDFLEMASLISGSRLFIGNQSFPFALAEGLKARRLLEVSSICPDVSVNGKGGQEFYFQEHFEKMVKTIMA